MLNKKISLILTTLLLVLVALAGCAAPAADVAPAIDTGPATVEQVTAVDVAPRLPDAFNNGLILLDVRTQQEWVEDGHIEGATLIPVQVLEQRAAAELPDKDAEIIVYCRSGNRSAQAAQMLVDMGYTDISDMGGINDWKAAGYPVEYGQ